MCYDICGVLEDPLEREICGESGFEEHLWEVSMPTVINQLVLVSKAIDGEGLVDLWLP